MELPNLGFNKEYGKKSTKRDGSNVRYMDSSTLLRPFNLPWALRGIVAVFVIAAAVIGVLLFRYVYDTIVLAPQRELESTQQNLDKVVSLDLPVLTGLIQLDDDTINSTLNANSYTLLDWNSLGTGSGTNIDLIKLPDGVTIIDAGIDYSNGISSLSSSEAARLLNGSWEFTVVRGNSIDMRVKYADFTSGTLDAAIQNAIDQQGLSGTPLGEAGVDAAGNSYQTGSVNVNGTAYNWQVSACVLTDAYSVSGLPADAMYVGIRLYL